MVISETDVNKKIAEVIWQSFLMHAGLSVCLFSSWTGLDSSKHEEGWENSRQLCKPETKSRVCITFENSPSPRGPVNMEKLLYCFYKIILKICANLKRHNRVYILSSKHSYRPMRARVVAQLFYK